MRWARKISDWIIREPLLAYGLAVANFIGFVIGTVFWYGDFFLTAGPPLWSFPFIPDCPLAAGVFSLALIQQHRGRSNNLLNQFAGVFNIKYGTWTMTFWLLYWTRTGDYNFVSLLMFATHLGLTIQGLLILQYLHAPNLRDTLIVFAWFVLSDIVDYAPIAPGRGGYGWYPPLPLGTQLVPPMLAHAVMMSWLLNGILLLRVMIQRMRLGKLQRAQG
ncbi:MAG: DUF1405 domain-containing protein [Chloroflexi bacterium]|nr:DUF1405 domain-containing protein [Chloroflexota bacterium]